MLSIPIEHAALVLKGKPPEELPHGLITPPGFVRQLVAEQKAKFGPEVYSAEAEERALSEHTLQFFFDQLGHEVLYRQTPAGPEVLAVGFDEIFALTDCKNAEKMTGLKTWGALMSRLEVPIKDRTLCATGDILLRVELEFDVKNSSGVWKKENFLVDSGTEITTFPAWLAKTLDLPLPQNPTRHATHAQTGLEIRSGLLYFKVVGMDQTVYQIPCLFLGDPNVRPSANAPAGMIPRNLLQPLHLLDVLRFEMKKDPFAGLAYGMMVLEQV